MNGGREEGPWWLLQWGRRDSLDGDAGFADVAETGFDVAIEAAFEKVADDARGFRGEGVEIDGGAEDVGEGVGDGFALEEALAGE